MPKPTADLRRLARDELLDIAAFAITLQPDELAAPSLCTGWRVDDVLSHIAWSATLSLREALITLARGGFHPGKAMSTTFGSKAVQHRHDHPVESSIELIRQVGSGAPCGRGAVFSRPPELLIDYVVHHLDIRQPLAKQHQTPDERLIAALDVAPTVSGLIGSKRRARGLRFVATNVEWAHGDGPLVKGPAEALLLAMTGRPSALDQLVGEGVSVVASRMTR